MNREKGRVWEPTNRRIEETKKGRGAENETKLGERSDALTNSDLRLPTSEIKNARCQ
jgi:hypothetical protein